MRTMVYTLDNGLDNALKYSYFSAKYSQELYTQHTAVSLTILINTHQRILGLGVYNKLITNQKTFNYIKHHAAS